MRSGAEDRKAAMAFFFLPEATAVCFFFSQGAREGGAGDSNCLLVSIHQGMASFSRRPTVLLNRDAPTCFWAAAQVFRMLSVH